MGPDGSLEVSCGADRSGQSRPGTGYGTHTRSGEGLGGNLKGIIRQAHWDRPWRLMCRILLGGEVGCGMRGSSGWGQARWIWARPWRRISWTFSVYFCSTHNRLDLW